MTPAMKIVRALPLALLLLGGSWAESRAQGSPGSSQSAAATANPEFEVATIKLSDPNQPGWALGTRGNHFFTINTNMIDLLTFAYGVHAKQIVNGPAWFLTEKFDIEGVPNFEGRPRREQLMPMLQKLLADRFKVDLHREKRELAAYALTVGKNGSRLKKSEAVPDAPSGYGFPQIGSTATFQAMNMTMAAFTSAMQRTVLDKPVVDETGLKDRYDFKLNWTPDEAQFIQFNGTGIRIPPGTDRNGALPGLYTAIQEQLGLRLEAVRTQVDVLFIDHAEKPSAN
jgi:uncharacterized protein (TIGR03435 family)